MNLFDLCEISDGSSFSISECILFAVHVQVSYGKIMATRDMSWRDLSVKKNVDIADKCRFSEPRFEPACETAETIPLTVCMNLLQFEVLSLPNRKKCQAPFISLAQIVSKYSPISSRNDYFLSANTFLVKDQQARQELKPSCHTVKTSWAETLIFFFLYPVHNVCCCNLSGGWPPVNVVTPFTREGVCSASALDADSTSRDRTSPGQRGTCSMLPDTPV